MSKCAYHYVTLMVVMSLLFTWFDACYKHGYMTGYSHGHFMYLLVIERIMEARPN